jgi:hypothetical protein
MWEPFFIIWFVRLGTTATPDLLRQPRVIVKMILEKQMECRLARETEVLGENLPQPRGGKPATNRLSYGAANVGALISRNPMSLHGL